MESELKSKIEETVLEILKSSDMESTTEFEVRKSASDKLGIDLSERGHKKLVKNVVQTYLEQQQEAKEDEEQQAEESEEEEDDKRKVGGKEYDDDGDLILCRLSNKRRVTLTEFRGKSLVSIREYYMKDGKELPSSKGISLTAEQWSNFSKNVPKIEKAIKRMEEKC